MLSLLRSTGIPAILDERYRRTSQQILIPRNCLEEATRVIDEARNSAAIPVPEPYAPAEEARSLITAITRQIGTKVTPGPDRIV